MKNKRKKSLGYRLVCYPMVVLNTIAFIGLLGAVFAPHVHPGDFMLPVYLGLAFPVLLLANVCFLLFWIAMRNWWFIMPLTVLAAAAVPAKNTFGFSVNKPELAEDAAIVKVLSYNTMNIGQSLPAGQEQNSKAILEYIVDKDPDVVCLQEFAVYKRSGFLTWNDISAYLKKYPYRHVSYRTDNKSRSIGVATFSKYPIVNRQVVDYASAFNLTQFSDIVIGADTIRFFNNHLESNHITSDLKGMVHSTLNSSTLNSYAGLINEKLVSAYHTRAQQADTVAMEIDKSPYRVIVCGDFNDVPVSYTYKTIRGKLADAFVDNHFLNMGFSFEHRLLRVRIDYILHDPTMLSADFDIDKVNYSDHYPIHCTLAL